MQKQAYVSVRKTLDDTPTIQCQIAIAVDVNYIIGQQGKNITTGIYMMDNCASVGSTNEGQLELSTVCNVGDYVGFTVYPVAWTDASTTVSITGINVSQGNVFTSQGYPVQQEPNYWIGQTNNSGNQTYQIQIKVQRSFPRKTTYYVNWDPYITAR